MYKLFITFSALLISSINAAPLDPHQATSYVTFNDNQNTVQHVQQLALPTVQKYLAQPTVPVQYSAAPAYSHPQLTQVSYPTVTKVAAALPTVQHVAQPTQVYTAAAVPTVYKTPAVYASAAHTPALYNPAPVAYAAAHQPQPVATYQAAPTLTKVVAKTYAQPEEYAPAHYEYGYSVQDPHTGDVHSQQEQRQGDQVVGQYSLQEADGTLRIVKYSDDGHGFNAVVEKQGHPTEAPAALYQKSVVAVPAAVAHAPAPAPQYVASHY